MRIESLVFALLLGVTTACYAELTPNPFLQKNLSDSNPFLFLANDKQLNSFIQNGIDGYEQSTVQEQETAQPMICRDESLKIHFYCEEKWEMQKGEDVVFVIISEKPDVTMMITKMKGPVHYLEQLSEGFLSESKQYAEGFKREKVKIGENEFLLVKAFALQNPNQRLADYFLIHEGALYGVLFAVEPSSQWDQHKFLIKKIIESFGFIDISN